VTEPTSPVCTACGVEWFHHGGMPHDFEYQPVPAATAARDMAADIDDLSRDYTEEIEAHRLTRERAEKAEAERDKWERRNSDHAAKYLDVLRERDTLAQRISDLTGEVEEAEARLAELVLEANDMLRYVENADDYQEARLATRRFRKKLRDIEGGEHG